MLSILDYSAVFVSLLHFYSHCIYLLCIICELCVSVSRRLWLFLCTFDLLYTTTVLSDFADEAILKDIRLVIFYIFVFCHDNKSSDKTTVLLVPRVCDAHPICLFGAKQCSLQRLQEQDYIGELLSSVDLYAIKPIVVSRTRYFHEMWFQ